MTTRDKTIERRDFLRIGAATGALVVGTNMSFGAALAAVGGTLRVRADLSTPAGDASATKYREAVRIMDGLPKTDGRNWLNQAKIHADFCPHGNWYFLPWHRGYLLALEEICGTLLGDSSFALPYWNWTNNRKLPGQFVPQTVGGKPNALFHAGRSMNDSNSIDSILGKDRADAIFGQGNINLMMRTSSYQAFGSVMPTGQDSTDGKWQRAHSTKGMLEGGPHDTGHGVVGGDMGSVPIAAKDPVFYMHHGNVDHIWSQWNAAGNHDETNTFWDSFAFKGNFWNTAGTGRIDYTVNGLKDEFALGYRYDDVPQKASPKLMAFAAVDAKPRALLKQAASVNAKLNAVSALPALASPKINEAVQGVLSTKARGQRLFAVITGEKPSDPDMTVQVFVNAKDAKGLTEDSAHYAGTFGFFANPAHTGTVSSAVDITDAVRTLSETGPNLTDELTIQLLPVGFGSTPPKEGFQATDIEIVLM